MAAPVRVADSGIHHDIKIKLTEHGEGGAGSITFTAVSEYFEKHTVTTTLAECRERMTQLFGEEWADADDHAVLSEAHHLLCYRPAEDQPPAEDGTRSMIMAIMEPPEGPHKRDERRASLVDSGDIQRMNNEREGIVSVEFGEGLLGIETAERMGRFGAKVRAFPRGMLGEMLPAERSNLIKVGMVILYVGYHSVVGVEFAECMRLIRASKRPVTIQFAMPDRDVVKRADDLHGERIMKNPLKRKIQKQRKLALKDSGNSEGSNFSSTSPTLPKVVAHDAPVAQVRVNDSGIHHDIKIKMDPQGDTKIITIVATTEYFDTYEVHATLADVRERLHQYYPSDSWEDNDELVLSNAHHVLCYKTNTVTNERRMAIIDPPNKTHTAGEPSTTLSSAGLAESPETRDRDRSHGVTCVEFSDGALGLEMAERKGKFGARIRSFLRDSHHEMLPAERSGLLARGMVVLRVGEEIVVGAFFNEVMNKIRTAPRPVILQFAMPDSPALARADVKYGSRDTSRATSMLRKATRLGVRQRHEAIVSENPTAMQSHVWLGYDAYRHDDEHNTLYHMLTALQINARLGEMHGYESQPGVPGAKGNMGAKFWRVLARSFLAKVRKHRGSGRKDIIECQKCFELALGYLENASNAAVWHDVADVYIRYGAIRGAAQVLVTIIKNFPSYRNLPAVIWQAAMTFQHLDMHSDALQFITNLLEYYDELDAAEAADASAEEKVLPGGRSEVEIKTQKIAGVSTLDVLFHRARILHLIGKERRKETVAAYTRAFTMEYSMNLTGEGEERRPITAPASMTLDADAARRTMHRVNNGTDGSGGLRPTTSAQQQARNESNDATVDFDPGASVSSLSSSKSFSGRTGLMRRRKKSLAYERAHHLIEWLDDPRTWFRRAERCFVGHSFLLCIDMCRQALKRLKRYEGPNRVYLRHTIEWTLAQSLYSVNAVEDALGVGRNVLLRDPKNGSISTTITKWEEEILAPGVSVDEAALHKEESVARDEDEEAVSEEYKDADRTPGTEDEFLSEEETVDDDDEEEEEEEEEEENLPMSLPSSRSSSRPTSAVRRRQARDREAAAVRVQSLARGRASKVRVSKIRAARANRSTSQAHAQKERRGRELRQARLEAEAAVEEESELEKSDLSEPDVDPFAEEAEILESMTEEEIALIQARQKMSATNIQCLFRSRKARKRVTRIRHQRQEHEASGPLREARQAAAVRMQSIARRRSSQARVREIRKAKRFREETQAATKMQGLFRSKAAKQRVTKIRAKFAHKELLKRRKERAEAAKQSQIIAKNVTPLMVDTKNSDNTTSTQYQFASPKRKKLLDRWHEKLARVFQSSELREHGIVTQMQMLVRAVASRASTFPEEACCALVDTDFASSFEQNVRRRNAGGNMVTRHGLPTPLLESLAEQAVAALRTPAYFNIVRTVCDVLSIREYARGTPGRHTHAWCQQAEHDASISVDEVLSSGNFSPERAINWSSNGTEKSLAEEMVLREDLASGMLSEKMTAFVEQEIMSHQLMSGRGVNLESKMQKKTKKRKKLKRIRGGNSVGGAFEQRGESQHFSKNDINGMISSVMETAEDQHIREWQRYKHFERLRKTMSLSQLPETERPMSLKRVKSHNRVRKLEVSPLGYDGKLPAIKKSAWSNQPARVTGAGYSNAKPTISSSFKTDVTAPSKVMWSGQRLNGAAAPSARGTLKKRLFASQKIPKSWVLPGFQSTW